MLFENRSDLEKRSTALALDEPAGEGVIRTRALGQYLIYCDALDEGFTPCLRRDGFWEAWVSLGLMRLVPLGWRCVNVGAHYGYYSLLLAHLSARNVIAYEPSPRSAELLERSAADNGLPVEVRCKAVWSEPGTRPFWIGQAASMNNSLVFADAVEQLPVPCVRLDDEIESCDLIFIDAEGAEAEILRGAERLRREGARVIVEIEGHRSYPPGWLESLGPLQWIDHAGKLAPLTAARIRSEPQRIWMVWLVNR